MIPLNLRRWTACGWSIFGAHSTWATYYLVVIAGNYNAITLVVSLDLQFNRELLELAGEPERHLVGVVLEHRGAGVFADVEGLAEGEAKTHGALDPVLGHLPAVDGERTEAALAALSPNIARVCVLLDRF
jgi:hypothetical protein